RLHVHRVKNGIPSVHPIRGDEMRALRKQRRDYPREAYVFVSERGGPISPIGFHRLNQRVGEAAKMPFPIHPHMLRHACGPKPQAAVEQERVVAHDTTSSSARRGQAVRVSLLRVLRLGLRGAGRAAGSATPSTTLAFAAASRLASISLISSIDRSI